MLKKITSTLLIFLLVFEQVAWALPGDLEIQFERESETTYRLQFKEEGVNIQEKRTLFDQVIETNVIPQKSSIDLFSLKSDGNCFFLKSKEKTNPFKIVFTKEGNATLVNLELKSRHLSLSTFGGIQTHNNPLKFCGLYLEGSCFHNTTYLSGKILGIKTNAFINTQEIKVDQAKILGKNSLINFGQMSGNSLTLHSPSLHNKGHILGENAYLSGNKIINSGLLDLNQNLRTRGSFKNLDQLKAKCFEAWGEGVKNTSHGDIAVSELNTVLQTLCNKGKIEAQYGSIEAHSLINKLAFIVKKDISLTIHKTLTNATSGFFSVGGAATLAGLGQFMNDVDGEFFSRLFSSSLSALKNLGTIQSVDQIKCDSLTKGLTNEGLMRSQNAGIEISTSGFLKNGGKCGILQGDNGLVKITAKDFTNNGLIHSVMDHLEITAEKAKNSNKMLAAKGVTLSSLSSFKNTEKGHIEGGETLTVSRKGGIDNYGILLSGRKMEIAGLLKNYRSVATFGEAIFHEIDNKGRIESPKIVINSGLNSGHIRGKQGLSLTIRGRLNNDGQIRDKDSLSLKGIGSIVNNATGTLLSEIKSVTIEDLEVVNHGTITAKTLIDFSKLRWRLRNEAGGKIDSELLRISGCSHFLNKGKITAKSLLNPDDGLSFEEFDNKGEFILTEGDLLLTSRDGKNLGTICTPGRLAFNLGEVKDFINDGTIDGGHLIFKGEKCLHNKGKVISREILDYSAGHLTNEGFIDAKKKLTFCSSFTNKPIEGQEHTGRIQSGDVLAINGQNQSINDGIIIAQKTLTGNFAQLINGGWLGSVQDDVNFKGSGRFTNLSTGVLTSQNQDITLDGLEIENDGMIKAKSIIDINNVRGVFKNNLGGQIFSEILDIFDCPKFSNKGTISAKNLLDEEVGLTFQEFWNEGAIQLREGDLLINFQRGLSENKGTIYTPGKLTINLRMALAQFINFDHIEGGHLKFTGKNSLINKGKLISQGTFHYGADHLTNNGLIDAQKKLTIFSSFSNVPLEDIENAGRIQSNDEIYIQSMPVSIDNNTFLVNSKNSGKIISKRNLVTCYIDLVNKGTLVSEMGKVHFLYTFLKNSGSVSSHDELLLFGKVMNKSTNTGENPKQSTITMSHESYKSYLEEKGTKLPNNLKRPSTLINKSTGVLLSKDNDVSIDGCKVNNKGSISAKSIINFQHIKGLLRNEGSIASEIISLYHCRGLDNKGILNAQEKFNLFCPVTNTSIEGQKNTGWLYSGGDFVIKTPGLALNLGTILAKKKLSGKVGGLSNKGFLGSESDDVVLVLLQAQNLGRIYSPLSLRLDIKDFFTSTGLLAGGIGSTVKCYGFNNWGRIHLMGDSSITASQGSIVNHPKSHFKHEGPGTTLTVTARDDIKWHSGFAAKEDTYTFIEGILKANCTGNFIIANAESITKTLIDKEDCYQHNSIRTHGNIYKIYHGDATRDYGPFSLCYFHVYQGDINANQLQIIGSKVSAGPLFQFNGNGLQITTQNNYKRLRNIVPHRTSCTCCNAVANRLYLFNDNDPLRNLPEDTREWKDEILAPGSNAFFVFAEKETICDSVRDLRQLTDNGNEKFLLVGQHLAQLTAQGEIKLTIRGKNIPTHLLTHIHGRVPYISVTGDVRGHIVSIKGPTLESLFNQILYSGEQIPSTSSLFSLFQPSDISGATAWTQVQTEGEFQIVPTLPFFMPSQEGITAIQNTLGQLNISPQQELQNREQMATLIFQPEKRVRKSRFRKLKSPQNQELPQETLRLKGCPVSYEPHLSLLDDITPTSLLLIPSRFAVENHPELRPGIRMLHHPYLQAQLLMTCFMQNFSVASISRHVPNPLLLMRVLETEGYLQACRLHGRTPQSIPENWESLSSQERLASQLHEILQPGETEHFQNPAIVYRLMNSHGELVLGAVATFPQWLRETFQSAFGRIAANYLNIENTQGSMTLHQPLVAQEGLLVKTTGDLTIHKKVLSKKILLDAERDLNNNGYVQAQEFLDIQFGGSVNNNARIVHHGEYIPPTIIASVLAGGSGIVYTDGTGASRRLGLRIEGRGTINNIGSAITAQGDILLKADQGIVHSTVVVPYLAGKETKKSGYFDHKKKTTWFFSNSVQEWTLLSTEGRILHDISHGSLHYFGGRSIGQDLDYASVAGGIFYHPVITENRVVTKKKSWGGLSKSKRDQRQQQAYMTQLINQTGVYHKSNTFIGGALQVMAPDVIFEAPRGCFTDVQLHHSDHYKSSSLMPTFFGSKAILEGQPSVPSLLSDLQLGDLSGLGQNPNSIQTLLSGIKRASQTWNKASGLAEAFSQDKLQPWALSQIAEVGLSYSKTSRKNNWTTSVPTVFMGNRISFRFLEELDLLGGPQLLGHKFIEFDTPKLTLGKATETWDSTNKSTSAQISYNLATESISGGFSHNQSQMNGKTYRNALIRMAEGGLISFGTMNELIMDGATIESDKVSGSVKTLTMRSYQDEMKSKSRGFSFNGSFGDNYRVGFSGSYSSSHQKKTNQQSAIYAQSGLGDLHIGALHVTGTQLDGQLANRAKSVTFTPLYDINRSSSFNMGISDLDVSSRASFLSSLGESLQILGTGIVVGELSRALGGNDLTNSLAGTLATGIVSGYLNEPSEESPQSTHAPHSGLETMGHVSYGRNGHTLEILGLNVSRQNLSSTFNQIWDMVEGERGDQNILSSEDILRTLEHLQQRPFMASDAQPEESIQEETLTPAPREENVVTITPLPDLKLQKSEKRPVKKEKTATKKSSEKKEIHFPETLSLPLVAQNVIEEAPELEILPNALSAKRIEERRRGGVVFKDKEELYSVLNSAIDNHRREMEHWENMIQNPNSSVWEWAYAKFRSYYAENMDPTSILEESLAIDYAPQLASSSYRLLHDFALNKPISQDTLNEFFVASEMVGDGMAGWLTEQAIHKGGKAIVKTGKAIKKFGKTVATKFKIDFSNKKIPIYDVKNNSFKSFLRDDSRSGNISLQLPQLKRKYPIYSSDQIQIPFLNKKTGNWSTAIFSNDVNLITDRKSPSEARLKWDRNLLAPFNVFAHGSSHSVTIHIDPHPRALSLANKKILKETGKVRLNPIQLARVVWTHPDYTPGQAVNLFTCSSTKDQKFGFAKKFMERMGVTVSGFSNTIYLGKSGTIYSQKNKEDKNIAEFIMLSPKLSPDKILRRPKGNQRSLIVKEVEKLESFKEEGYGTNFVLPTYLRNFQPPKAANRNDIPFVRLFKNGQSDQPTFGTVKIFGEWTTGSRINPLTMKPSIGCQDLELKKIKQNYLTYWNENSNGTYVIVSHGERNKNPFIKTVNSTRRQGFETLGDKHEYRINSKEGDYRLWAKLIKKDISYKKGQSVVLLTCFGGGKKFPQQLANKLKVVVYAPNGPIDVTETGELKMPWQNTELKEYHPQYFRKQNKK